MRKKNHCYFWDSVINTTHTFKVHLKYFTYQRDEYYFFFYLFYLRQSAFYNWELLNRNAPKIHTHPYFLLYTTTNQSALSFDHLRGYFNLLRDLIFQGWVKSFNLKPPPQRSLSFLLSVINAQYITLYLSNKRTNFQLPFFDPYKKTGQQLNSISDNKDALSSSNFWFSLYS